MTRKFLRLTFYVLALTVIFCAVIITALSFLLKDLKHYTELTFERIEKNTGYTVALDDINWIIARGAGLRIDNMTIIDTKTNTLLFRSQKVHILTELAPLLKKTLIVSSVVLGEPEFYILRKPDGGWHFSRMLSGSDRVAKRAGSLFDFSISLKKLSAVRGTLIYRDSRASVTSALENVSIQICRDLTERKYAVQVYGEQPHKDTTGRISIKADVLATPREVSFISAIDSPEKLYLQAELTATSVSPGAFSGYVPGTKIVPVPTGRFDANIMFSINPGWEFTATGYVKSPDLLISCNGNKPLNLGEYGLSFDGRGTPDAFFCDTLVLKTPKDITVAGSLCLEGVLNAEPRFKLDLLTNRFSVPALCEYLIARNAVPDTLKVFLKKIKAGTLLVKKTSFDAPLHALLSPQPLACLRAEADIADLSLQFSKTVAPLQITDAAFTLDNNTLTGIMHARLFDEDNHTINALVQSPFAAPSWSMSVDSTLYPRSLNALTNSLPGTAKPAEFCDGRVSAQTHIRYPVGDVFNVAFSSSLDLTRSSYSVTKYVEKQAGISNMVTITGNYGADNSDDNIAVAFDLDNSLHVAATVNDLASPVIQGSYSLQQFPFDSLTLLMVPDTLYIKGTCTGIGSFHVPSLPRERFPVRGALSLNDVELGAVAEDRPLITAHLMAEIDGDSVTITNGRSRIGTTTFSATGELSALQNPQGHLTINADLFDIDDFVSTIGRIKKLVRKGPKKNPLHKTIFHRTNLDIDLAVEKINFKGWNGTETTSSFSYKNAVMSWDNILLHADNATVNGSVLFDFSVGKPKKLELKPTYADVDFTWLVPALHRKKTIRGTTNFSGALSSIFDKGHQILPNMQGSLHIAVTDGKMQKFTILSKILSALNIWRFPKLKGSDFMSRGMPFDSMTSDLIMKNGIMATENLILKGPGINLSAVGSLDFPQKQMDMNVGVQVLATIAKILGNIPIAGDIVTGKNKTLTIGYFSVSGPFAEPVVNLQPMASLSSGVLKIFRSILDIPRDLISPLQNEDQATEIPNRPNP